jgi:hypothetical protein
MAASSLSQVFVIAPPPIIKGNIATEHFSVSRLIWHIMH